MERIAIDGGKLNKMRLLFLKDNLSKEVGYFVVDYTTYLEEQVKDLQQDVSRLFVDFVGLNIPARVYKITRHPEESLSKTDYELGLWNDIEGPVAIDEKNLDGRHAAGSCLVVGKDFARLEAKIEGEAFFVELPV